MYNKNMIRKEFGISIFNSSASRIYMSPETQGSSPAAEGPQKVSPEVQNEQDTLKSLSDDANNFLKDLAKPEITPDAINAGANAILTRVESVIKNNAPQIDKLLKQSGADSKVLQETYTQFQQNIAKFKGELIAKIDGLEGTQKDQLKALRDKVNATLQNLENTVFGAKLADLKAATPPDKRNSLQKYTITLIDALDPVASGSARLSPSSKWNENGVTKTLDVSVKIGDKDLKVVVGNYLMNWKVEVYDQKTHQLVASDVDADIAGGGAEPALVAAILKKQLMDKKIISATAAQTGAPAAAPADPAAPAEPGAPAHAAASKPQGTTSGGPAEGAVPAPAVNAPASRPAANPEGTATELSQDMKTKIEALLGSADKKTALNALGGSLDPKEWTSAKNPDWTQKLAAVLGTDIPVDKFQQYIGTKPDGKVGPHTVYKMLQKLGSDKAEGYKIAALPNAGYIDRWEAALNKPPAAQSASTPGAAAPEMIDTPPATVEKAREQIKNLQTTIKSINEMSGGMGIRQLAIVIGLDNFDIKQTEIKPYQDMIASANDMGRMFLLPIKSVIKAKVDSDSTLKPKFEAILAKEPTASFPDFVKQVADFYTANKTKLDLTQSVTPVEGSELARAWGITTSPDGRSFTVDSQQWVTLDGRPITITLTPPDDTISKFAAAVDGNSMTITTKLVDGKEQTYTLVKSATELKIQKTGETQASLVGRKPDVAASGTDANPGNNAHEERIQTIANSLHPQEKFISPELDQAMQRMEGFTKMSNGFYKVTIENVPFEVTESRATFDRQGNLALKALQFRKITGENPYAVDELYRGVSYLGKLVQKQDLNKLYDSSAALTLDPSELKAVAEFAKKDWDSQQDNSADTGTLKRFDLPKNEKIGWVSLIAPVAPGGKDPMVSAKDHATNFPQLLKESGGYSGIQATTKENVTDPEQALNTYLQTEFAAGTRNFYIDLFAHGSPTEGLSFGDKKLSPTALVAILKTYLDKDSNVKITVNSFTCFGGGMRDAVMSFVDGNPQYKDRVAVFLQTKPNMVNASHVDASSVSDAQTSGQYDFYDYSSIYNVFLQKYFIDKKGKSPAPTYGEAVHYADLQTQKYIFTNPESIVSGTLARGLPVVATATGAGQSGETESTVREATAVAPAVEEKPIENFNEQAGRDREALLKDLKTTFATKDPKNYFNNNTGELTGETREYINAFFSQLTREINTAKGKVDVKELSLMYVKAVSEFTAALKAGTVNTADELNVTEFSATNKELVSKKLTSVETRLQNVELKQKALSPDGRTPIDVNILNTVPTLRAHLTQQLGSSSLNSLSEPARLAVLDGTETQLKLMQRQLDGNNGQIAAIAGLYLDNPSALVSLKPFLAKLESTPFVETMNQTPFFKMNNDITPILAEVLAKANILYRNPNNRNAQKDLADAMNKKPFNV